MSYAIENIRNICLLGHGSNGKTSLAESMLFTTGAIDRLGRVVDGNTVGDSDPEEIRRQISISLAAMYVEYKKTKINILDTPGYFDFAGEVYEALRVADAGIIVVSAKDGLNVGAEKSWKYLSDRNKPRAIYISKTDEEHADFNRTFDQLREKFGNSVCPVTAPIMEGEKVVGIVDIITRKAYKFAGGKRTEFPVPAEMTDRIDELFTELCESVAENDESGELLDKYLDTMELSPEEIYTGLSTGVSGAVICPVYCGSAASGLGTTVLLDAIVSFFPAPTENGEALDPNGPAAALVFKTLSDQYGKFSIFKVMSGKINSDMSVVNTRTGTVEKIARVYSMQGKKNIEVSEITCGDIGAVTKLTDTRTGDTLSDPKTATELVGIEFEAPCYTMAIAPKVKGQEDKIAAGLTRLGEEDCTFSVFNNGETKQMTISGLGDIHLDVLCSKLKSKFGVEVVLFPARVPYREKITKTVEIQGRHKKQTGGHGQFADVRIRFEPQEEQEDLVFAEEVFGGSVPRNFFPAVEKGLRDCIQKGVIAGYPMVNLKAVLYDGGYHPVDSSEMAFKTAAGIAYKDGIPKANPVLLEPIGLLKVTIPADNLGDIMSDLSKRRGSPMGMSAESGMQVVEAEVPMAEMSSYAIDLRSITQGRGYFTYEFVRYEQAPRDVQQKIMDEAKALAEADDK